ncbi:MULTISPECIES: aldehyde dehydrogenase family protein [Ralstonia]|jgi:aldehyde dehydrogenase (NAD+)|uniref:3-succinoylsemialdehyde-pyridine dehydrogenase n=6 Tax=Pseudomonadota TaxID=1224 RepID=A0ABM9IQ71_RALPI|nr:MULTISPECIES: aldehyde dehydrogenase family protein [Ralstonia]MBA4200415.1 aldehyde dehydrogenase family protein [Ralstonia sp.]MBA4231021.1 aldehyde dehydrogenase family protein [Ralstonia sp.]MBA4235630.1 aldehyde dehydrogenase family protein [Ralstonia sp.]MBA4401952.1 aldehyde dehydrogenase family protein [Ralstonia sp.]POH88783.1 aldehyde dehydrogenase family protein [Ralstonia pickettii]
MQQRDKLFINGKWVAPQGKGVIEVIHSATEAVMGTIPEGSAADAEAAVAAARAAFDDWAATPVAKRAEYIQKIADGLHARSEELAQLIAGEVGMPIKLARAIQVGGPVYNWSNFAKLLSTFEFEEQVGNSLVVREPVGVVGAITPWNYPLNQITLKVAPALAAGCTVVLKPSEVAPLNAFVLAEVIEEAGLPPGVFNLVTGYGPVVGEVLASDPEVDMVSFTGSTRAGKRVAELASQSVKRVALELGGKSASVILDDADLASAVKGTLSACFLNSGQTCSAHTRMLVPRAKYEEVKALAAQFAAAYVPGDPAQESTRLGPLISAVQRDRVLGYIRKGLEEGAELITGGADTPEGLTTGYFVKPTVLGNVKTTDTVAREEIFGPVLTVICYDDEEEAVRIANDSIYGLGGGVWSGDESRAIRVARRIRTGQVNINGGPFNMQAPFGGYKQSGNGRENGKYGLEEFLEYKALQLNPAKTA